MRRSEKHSTWLEPALRQELRRVPAPRELWDRVALPALDAPLARPARTVVWLLAAASVAVSVMAVAWGYHPHTRAEFRSKHAAAMREWIRTRTGVDVPLASPSHAKIEMISAAIEPSGVVEVRYRAANSEATLSIRRETNGPLHAQTAAVERATEITWTAAEHQYTLTVHRPGDMSAACLVCHSDTAI